MRRLEACKRLGWTEIEATVMPLDALNAELAEIDENLIRAELTVLERAEQLARRKEIYEALHPEARRGGDRRSEDFKTKQFRFETFATNTAAKTGLSPRTVQHEVQIATRIAPDVRLSRAVTDRPRLACASLLRPNCAWWPRPAPGSAPHTASG